MKLKTHLKSQLISSLLVTALCVTPVSYTHLTLPTIEP